MRQPRRLETTSWATRCRAPLPRAACVVALAIALGMLVGAACSRRTATEPPARSPGRAPAARSDDPASDAARGSAIAPATSTRPVAPVACADCHADIARSFAQHPMGQSLAPVDSAARVEDLTAQGNNPFQHDGFRYEAMASDGGMIHRRTRIDERDDGLVEQADIDYVVGSGHHGRAYLLEADGRMLMSPMTWYPQQQRWDVSPGYETNNFGFQRPVTDDCLFCHSQRVQLVAGQVNAFQSPHFPWGHAIGCQRCHGEGHHHAAAYRDGHPPAPGADDVVNPARLEPELRESVCQQCHVAGAARVERRGRGRWDFQPGQSLAETLRLFVAASSATADSEFVGQAEQMVLSACYQSSGGKLGCISCHDPHGLPEPAQRVEFYRARCLNCHGVDDCGLETGGSQRQAVQDSCFECHMPRRDTTVRHVATTNHSVPRRASGDGGEQRSPGAGTDAEADGEWPIVLFPPRAVDDQPAQAAASDEVDDELARDRAVGVVEALATIPQSIESSHLVTAVRELNRAVRRHADDTTAWRALAEACLRLDRRERAREALRAVLRSQPDDEYALASLGLLDQRGGRWVAAEETFRQLAQRNPADARYRFEWANCLAQLGHWDAMEQVVTAATTRFPFEVGLRQLNVQLHLLRGRAADAEQEMQRLRRWAPAALPELETWYSEQLRRR